MLLKGSAMCGIIVAKQREEDALMKITELFPDVITEDIKCEFKGALSSENPVIWAKTIVSFANNNGGILLVGVSNDGEAFGIDIDEIEKTKKLVAQISDQNISPPVKLRYMIRNVDADAERFVLAISIAPSELIVRYSEGDFNNSVVVKNAGNSTSSTQEAGASLSKRQPGADNETSDVRYNEAEWTNYAALCRAYRKDSSAPTLKELQNAEIVTEDGYAKTGFLIFQDGYDGDETLICCRLWRGKTKIGDVLDSKRFKGSLPDVFQKTLVFIERNIKTGWKKAQNGGREAIRSYPKEALREALATAIAHRDYSIAGTQVDVDIYSDRIDIVSPGSWLPPKMQEKHPRGSIPPVDRNMIVAACLNVANLMEPGVSGFQAIIDSYKGYNDNKQPGVLLLPGFLNLRLFDLLFQEEAPPEELTDKEKVIWLLKESPMPVKDLQAATRFKSRSRFLTEILNPLIEKGVVYREGNPKSPTAVIKLKKKGKE